MTFTVHSLSSCSCTGVAGGSPGVHCWAGSYGVSGAQARQRWRGLAGWSGWGQRTCVLRSEEPLSRWHLLQQNGAYGVTYHLQTGEIGVIDCLTQNMFFFQKPPSAFLLEILKAVFHWLDMLCNFYATESNNQPNYIFLLLSQTLKSKGSV